MRARNRSEQNVFANFNEFFVFLQSENVPFIISLYILKLDHLRNSLSNYNYSYSRLTKQTHLALKQSINVLLD
jgi:hypothetical protein